MTGRAACRPRRRRDAESARRSQWGPTRAERLTPRADRAGVARAGGGRRRWTAPRLRPGQSPSSLRARPPWDRCRSRRDLALGRRVVALTWLVALLLAASSGSSPSARPRCSSTPTADLVITTPSRTSRRSPGHSASCWPWPSSSCVVVVRPLAHPRDGDDGGARDGAERSMGRRRAVAVGCVASLAALPAGRRARRTRSRGATCASGAAAGSSAER